MQLGIDANAAKFKVYERRLQNHRRAHLAHRGTRNFTTQPCATAATPPDAAGERFMLTGDLLGQTATQRSAACEPLRTSGWER